MSIPAFVNPRSGSAAAAERALANAGSAFAVHRVEPRALAAAIRTAIADGATRVVVAGGDGTVEAAASVLCGTPVELAVVPGGTLNHFARDYGVPLDATEAVRAAMSGAVRTVDVGVVNDRVFINTSSVGAYVVFVRTRERVERYVGYRLASLLAALRILPRLRSFRLSLTLPDEQVVCDTPLLFVGVGERTLAPPGIGSRVRGGVRALHVMVVPRPGNARRWTRAYDRAASGRTALLHGWSPSFVIAHLVDQSRLELPRKRGHVAVDGEIAAMRAPLEYRLWRDALRLVVQK